MTQPLVLAIEPDLRQAAIVKRIVREKALSDIAVVETLDAAIEAMRTSVPDVLLLSALLSPRDEDELMTHLRTLDNAGHVQTHTIPQLASSLEVPGSRASRGLLSAFRRKKEAAPIDSGCDPDMFAEEIRVFIQRADAKRRELAESGRAAPAVRGEGRTQAKPGSQAAEPEPAGAEPSSWSSPFEWKPTASTRSAKPEEEPVVAVAKPAVVAPPALTTAPPVEMPAVEIEPVVLPEPVVEVAPIIEMAPIVEMPPIAEPTAVVVEASPVAETPVVEAPAPAIDIFAASEMMDLLEIEVVDLAPAVEAPIAPAALAIVPKAAVPVDVETEIALEPLTAKNAEPSGEWAPPPPVPARRTGDRLGPLAGWARAETPRKAKPEAVTADDVRALMSSLAVPPAVASVTYARGCRIRRVRVPAAAEHDSQSFGTVILSRRILAEQRERRQSV